MQYGDGISGIKTLAAGVPEGSVLGSLIYALYTTDISEIGDTSLATFANDTAILAIRKDHPIAAANLQTAVD